MKNSASLIPTTITAFSSRLAARWTRAFLLTSVCLLIICAGHPSIAQEGQPRDDASAVSDSSRARKITGRVVADDGRPLADTVVYIYRSYARVPSPPQSATTDAEGKFQSPPLQPGLYFVSANLPGFALSQTDLQENGEQKLFRPGDSLNLTMVKGGVITGVVRDGTGEPVVGVLVRVVRVRDANGKRSTRPGGFVRDRMTDDRGIYRIYGLEPGTYIVSAGGGSRFFGISYAYSGDVATYFPSSTRDTAADVVVNQGEEVTGIDIRYRNERGRNISGTISGTSDSTLRMGISVILKQMGSAGFTDQTYIQPTGKAVFSFDGVADGEYELMAQQGTGTEGEQSASAPKRVTVKGADVTGVELTLAPLASIAGRAVLEPAPKEACGAEGGAATLLEVAITARRDEKAQTKEATTLPLFSMGGISPDEQGDYGIRNLMGGSYRLSARLPNDFWYTRSISLPGAASTLARPPATTSKSAPAKSAPAASPPSVITLKQGERLTGTTIQIAQDGATVRGRIIMSPEGANLPDNLKVYLIPTERERAEDVLRYSETSVMSDGAFILRNLAPGRYLIIARPAADPPTLDSAPRPTFWDADARAKLRREAEALNAAIELKPCQRVSDYELRFLIGK